MKDKYPEYLPKNEDWLVNRTKLFKQIKKELKINNSDKILEFGCSDGHFINLIKGTKKAIGVDINDKIVKNAPNNILCRDITDSKFKDKSFNKIFSFHTIEHIKDQKRLFKELDRILENKGIIVLVYPYELIRGMAILRTALKTMENPRKLHIRKLNPKKIQDSIKETSLKHIKSKLVFCRLPQYLTILEKN